MKWAQSPDTVFLDVKYAHRFDAPGCLEIENRTISIKADSFVMSGDCTESGQTLHIDLQISLFAEIDPDLSFYSDSSVGRLTVNLRKKEKGVWTLPMKGITKPTNLLVWWEMKERYADEMLAFEEQTRTEKSAQAAPNP